MQKFISKYGTAAHLALLAVAPLFLFPFASATQIATVELWLVAVALIWTIMEPSRRTEERLHDARSRVAKEIVRDPLFWVMLVIAVFAAIRWLNGGIEVRCDYNNGAPYWYLQDPVLKYLPGSTPVAGYQGFVAALVSLVLIQGCSHALGKTARIAFFLIAATLSGISALVAVASGVLGGAEALHSAWCANMTAASFVGVAYGIQLVGGVVALVGAFERRWNKQLFFLLFAVGGNAAGLFFFAPIFTVIVFSAAAIMALLISSVYAAIKLGVTPLAKCLTVLCITLIIPVLAVLGVMLLGEKSNARVASMIRTARTTPNQSSVQVDDVDLAQSVMYLVGSKRVSVIEDGAIFPQYFGERRNVLSSVANRIWQDHPWLGTGLGAYGMALRFGSSAEDWQVLNPKPDEKSLCDALSVSIGDAGEDDRQDGYVQMPSAWKAIGADQVNTPFNGWWTLLAERGIIGAVSLALVLGLLLFNYVRRLIGAIGRSVFVPAGVAGILVLLALTVENFADASFLRLEVMAATAAFLAVAVGSFPPAKQSETDDENK